MFVLGLVAEAGLFVYAMVTMDLMDDLFSVNTFSLASRVCGSSLW